MRIHQVTHLFYPDELAGAALYTDLARFFRDRGHDVRVTSTFSYYPALRYRPEDDGVIYRDETFEGIPVRRVGMHLPADHRGWQRLLPEVSYAWRLLCHARFSGWTPDVVITACPMLAQCIAQRFLYLGRNVPRVIIIQDFMVDAALELGILKIPGLGPVLRGIERWAFRSAATLSTISPVMAAKLAPLERRTLVIQNWIHESLHRGAFEARSANLKRDSARLFYSGNLGVKQGLPQFLEMFKKVGAEWSLDIHGGGAELAGVRESVNGIDNVRLGALHEESEYLRDLASATACLITQKPGVGANFLPSKLLPALATGTPVLAVCDSESPLGREVLSGGFGAVVAPGDYAELKSVLARWAADPALVAEFGRAALTRASAFSREYILGLYESELCALAGEEVPAAVAERVA